MIKVRFCEHNKGGKKVFKRLRESNPSLDVKMKDCMKKCGPCHKTLIATVDGKTVCGVDLEDLYRKIINEVENRD